MTLVPRRRGAMLLVCVLAALMGLGARLVYVQALHAGEYEAMARQQRVRSIDLLARRGTIYDRTGKALALSVPARTVFANPKQVADPAGTAKAIAPILALDPDELARKLVRPTGFVYLARRVDVAKAREVEKLRLPGISTVDEPRRTYPGGRLASNVVGLVGTDANGLAGLEGAYEPLLRGRPGHRVLEQDPQGRAIPQGVFREEKPVAGSDLVLTLHQDIQFVAERALAEAIEDHDAKGGTIVVMDPRSGDLLAMASSPTFDPNTPADLDGPAEMRNRAVTDMYEPGSVNKLITAAAAIEEGVVSPETAFAVPARINVAGTSFSDAHDHATKRMSFADVFAESSNVGTIKVALQLGPKRLEDYLRAFGYGRPTGLGFPGESGGILPKADRWRTSLPTMAIGQGVSVTSLQITRAFATVANGGVAVEPRLVAGWVDRTGAHHRSPAARSTRVVSEETAGKLRAMLAKAVTDGTGTAAQVPGYRTGGKTGTAQKPGPRGGYQGYMASFIGMLPADDPRLVVAVVLDDPSPIWGGVVAAPVFREVAQAAARILRIPPNDLGASPAATSGLAAPKPELMDGPPVPASRT